MLDDDVVSAARLCAADLFAELEQVRAVVIATEDGMDVASQSDAPLDAARFSAIASSMAAIGEVVSHETDLGTVRCVMVEADGGYLVMRGCRRGSTGLVVAALVGREALLGLVIHRVSKAAKELAR